LIVKLGAIATAIAAILGLIFLVWPNIKPQSSPSVTSGKITEIDWEQPYDSSLHYYVDVEIVGYNGQKCTLGYSVYTANGQYSGISETDAENFQAQSNDDTGGATIAISQPRYIGTYYVIFTLYAPNGTALSVQNSPNFNIP
jgi:hypothetical protein